MDQYAGPQAMAFDWLNKSTNHGPMAELNSRCKPAVNGISLRAPVEPLVGTRRVTGSRVNMFLAHHHEYMI